MIREILDNNQHNREVALRMLGPVQIYSGGKSMSVTPIQPRGHWFCCLFGHKWERIERKPNLSRCKRCRLFFVSKYPQA